MVDGKKQWKAWLYLAPAIVLMLVFTVWPIFNTILMAFRDGYNPQYESNPEFTGWKFGIQNFIDLFAYASSFTNALVNTLLLCVLTVPISTMLALLIAVALNSIKPLQKLLQTIFFLPYVTNSIAIGMVFSVMFNIVGQPGAADANYGIINQMFGTTINWISLGSEKVANYVVMVIYIVWNALPFKILVLLGGLQGVNKQYYDAAKVDGTSKSRVFWRITVPLVSPMIVYVLITGFIGGFKEYSSIVGIFGEGMGAPGQQDHENMNTMVGIIYDVLPSGQYGRASAAALVLFAIILVVTLINLYVSKKNTHY